MGGLGQQLKGVILYVSLCARQRFFKKSAIRFLQNAKKGGRTAEKGIQDQFSDFLVGSGARNMVTQNESESIDFDYNLNIISCPDWEKPRSIKESVRKVMNRIMTNEGLGTVNDSTSCLTTKTISFEDSPENKWSIDLCIVTKASDGNWQRLIHEKTGFAQYDRYFWNTTPNSEDYSYKAAKIKECPGWWDEVRNSYLRIKNHYLQNHDYNHPSFVCYVEAVNEIYNRISCRK